MFIVQVIKQFRTCAITLQNYVHIEISALHNTVHEVSMTGNVEIILLILQIQNQNTVPPASMALW